MSTDFSTSRCVLLMCLVKLFLLTPDSILRVASWTLMPVSVCTISVVELAADLLALLLLGDQHLMGKQAQLHVHLTGLLQEHPMVAFAFPQRFLRRFPCARPSRAACSPSSGRSVRRRNILTCLPELGHAFN